MGAVVVAVVTAVVTAVVEAVVEAVVHLEQHTQPTLPLFLTRSNLKLPATVCPKTVDSPSFKPVLCGSGTHCVCPPVACNKNERELGWSKHCVTTA